MRIALIAGALAPSPESVATTVKNVVDQWTAHPDQVLIIAPGVGASSYRGIRIHRWRLGDEVGLRRLLTSWRPDIVHIADPGQLGSAPVRVVNQVGLTYVVSQHSMDNGPFKERWRGMTAGGDASVLATSRAGLDALTQTGVSARLWTPGVDTDLFSPSMRHDAMAGHWAKGGRLVVGHVGPIHKKNVFRRLVEVGSLPGVRLVALRAGAGHADATRLQELRERVPGAKVLGEVGGVDLAHAFASFDVVVQARKKDLDVHAARRALASGVPVVGADFGGLTDVVRDGHNGLLGDPVEAIERLRDDPALRDRLAGHARASVLGRTWADAAAELLDVHYPHALAPAAQRFATA